MAESYSVKAVLSAIDKNFSSVMKGAGNTISSLKDTITGGIGFGVLMGIGQKTFSVISNSVTDLVGEINSSNSAWKTFQGNMEMTGMGVSEIKSVKKELQSFAEETIYSASDMATTYAQLAAVGTKNTAKLVKGFGGLASAAENPTQAMKTLSQQATQMAAKPTVAWQDFKLMLEQTPAGIAAVAKQMGMSTTELITNVQDGKIATEDFFDAITQVGTNDAFTKLATEYKTVGQAMDGLQETVSNKLAPSFDVLSSVGISAISGIVDKMGELDGQAIADKISSFIDKASGYWEVLKSDFIEVKDAFGEAAGAIIGNINGLSGEFGSTESIESFSDVLGVAKDGLIGFSDFIEEHADIIAKVLPYLPQLVAGYAGFKIVSAVAPGMMAFSKGIIGLAGKGIGSIAGKLFGIGNATYSVGTASATSASQVLASAAAFVALGAGVALIAAGLWIMSNAAVALADSGGLAIGVMVGMVAVVAGLAFGASLLGTSLTAGAVGFVAFGAAVVLAGAGMMLLSTAAISLSNAGGLAIGVMVGMVAVVALLAAGAALLGPALVVGGAGMLLFGAGLVLVASAAVIAGAALNIIVAALPGLTEHGASGAVAIAQLALGMTAFGAGALVAGAGSLVLGAGLVVVGAGAVVAAAGVVLLGAGVVVLGAGLTLVAASALVVGAALPVVAVGATVSAAAMLALLASFTALSAVMVVLGTASLVASVGMAAFGVAILASSAGAVVMAVALMTVNSSMKTIAKNAKSASNSLDDMESSIDIVGSGLDAIGSKAKSAMSNLISKFKDAEGKAKTSGQQVGNNFKTALQSGLNQVPAVAVLSMTQFNSGIRSGGSSAISAANSISVSIVSAMRSASGGSYSCGAYIGQGLANGMSSALGTVRSVAAQLAAAAEAAIRAKAQIHSPSKIADKLGTYWGIGFAGGIKSMLGLVQRYSEDMVEIPSLAVASGPDISALRSNGTNQMSEEYSYNRNDTYTIYVPLKLEGREIAKATATYTREEIENYDERMSRKKGR